MTKIAFYAPLKPPNHPVPSGDRAMAQNLVTALTDNTTTVELASEFRSRDGNGDPTTQARKMAQAEKEITRIIAQKPNWQAWITYHNYYKAPDLIGPAVARALHIPYLLIEATRARKRLNGPWDAYARAAEAATDAAHTVFYLTTRDAEALRAYGHPAQTLIHLRPFLPHTDLPPATKGGAQMLSVGMFRSGDKLSSYNLIAETLTHLAAPNWQLSIAGGGPERDAVKTLFARFGDSVRFLGALDADALAQAYQSAGILLWPGVNEAFGMTYLEAQAAGLVAIAQDRPGVRDVLAPGPDRPAPEAGAQALAAVIDGVLEDDATRARLGATARQHVAQNHLLGQAQNTLNAALQEALA